MEGISSGTKAGATLSPCMPGVPLPPPPPTCMKAALTLPLTPSALMPSSAPGSRAITSSRPRAAVRQVLNSGATMARSTNLPPAASRHTGWKGRMGGGGGISGNSGRKKKSNVRGGIRPACEERIKGTCDKEAGALSPRTRHTFKEPIQRVDVDPVDPDRPCSLPLLPPLHLPLPHPSSRCSSACTAGQ